MNQEKLLASVISHETYGGRANLTAYQDSKGIWTIGYGRNLQVLRISQDQADEWLNKDINAAVIAASNFPEFPFLDTEARQNAFIEMVYNMGPMRVHGFIDMLPAIRKQDWKSVAREALNSVWAHEVGKRAVTIANMLLTGEFPVSSK